MAKQSNSTSRPSTTSTATVSTPNGGIDGARSQVPTMKTPPPPPPKK